MLELDADKKRQLLERTFINYDAILGIAKDELRRSLSSKYDSDKIVGVFVPNAVSIETRDKGSIIGNELIEYISSDLARLGFIVVTQNGIEDSSALSSTETNKLWNNLKESESHSIDFSACLAGVVRSAIFVLNNVEGSSVLHEIREFHKNAFFDNILSVGFLFHHYKPKCNMVEVKGDGVHACVSSRVEDCACNEANCDFFHHISTSNREPFIRNSQSFLFIIRDYSDIIKSFSSSYSQCQINLTKYLSM